jgi:hypothetical protein
MGKPLSQKWRIAKYPLQMLDQGTGARIDAMCYSAQIQAAYLKYLRETGAEMDIDQFVEIFGARMSDSSIRIPRAVERWFDEPRNDAERKIKSLIDEYRNGEITKLEREVFAQKKRLADADRALATKVTKAASESKRIASDKIEKAITRLDRLKAVKPHPAESRIFPLHYAPIVIQDGARRVMRLARYHCRKPGEAAFIDRKLPGLYNALGALLTVTYRRNMRAGIHISRCLTNRGHLCRANPTYF